MIEQKISDDKNFAGVKRTVHVVGCTPNSDAQTIDVYYRIKYTQDEKDITSMFNSQLPTLQISNATRRLLRDEPTQGFVAHFDNQDNIVNEHERYRTIGNYEHYGPML